METQGPPINFLNVEYFLRVLYETLFGSGSGSTASFDSFLAFASGIWLFLTGLAIVVSFVALGFMIYNTIRLYQIRALEAPLYATISAEEEHRNVEHSRWAYILSLVEDLHDNDWRQAIMEADIMLDEMLTRLGYIGDSVGEKLRSVNPVRFLTLSNAWEAHKVRNAIAHEGSTFTLTERLAHRTIANYEAVFREHGEI
jgi:hypothetical protein